MVSANTAASSSTQELIISVDIGTTSTRAIAFNKLAEVVSTVQVEYDQSTSGPTRRVIRQLI
jgi:glycerol kinase